MVKNNISSISSTLTNSSTTDNLTKKLSDEKKENLYLKERLQYANSDQFVQEQAQEKLGLLKTGEYFVIAPTSTPLNTQTSVPDQKPNWQKWWELFF